MTALLAAPDVGQAVASFDRHREYSALPRQALTRKRAPAREVGRSDRVVRWTFKVRDRCR